MARVVSDAPMRASLVFSMTHATSLKKTIPEHSAFGQGTPVQNTSLADIAQAAVGDHGKLELEDDPEEYDPQTHMRIHCQSGEGRGVWCTVRRNARVSELKRLISCEYARSPEQLVLRGGEETLSDDRLVVEVAAGSLQVHIASPQRMATGSGQEGVRVYDLGRGREECTFGSHTHVNALAWDPHGVMLAAGSALGSADVFDVFTGTRHNFYNLHTSINSLVWSPDGSRLALGAEDGLARVYNFSERCEEAILRHPLPVHGVSFSGDGQRLATGCADDKARVWLLSGDSSTAKQELAMRHGMPVLSVAWKPTRQSGPAELHLATGSGSGLARLFDINADGQELRIFKAGTSVNAVAFNPDGNLLAVASDDSFLRVFEVNTGDMHYKFPHGGKVTCCSWESEGKRIATGASDGFARVIHMEDEHEEVVFDEGRFIYSVAYCPDVGKDVASHLIETNVSERTLSKFDKNKLQKAVTRHKSLTRREDEMQAMLDSSTTATKVGKDDDDGDDDDDDDDNKN